MGSPEEVGASTRARSAEETNIKQTMDADELRLAQMGKLSTQAGFYLI